MANHSRDCRIHDPGKKEEAKLRALLQEVLNLAELCGPEDLGNEIWVTGLSDRIREALSHTEEAETDKYSERERRLYEDLYESREREANLRAFVHLALESGFLMDEARTALEGEVEGDAKS
jgi:hypothetical protein